MSIFVFLGSQNRRPYIFQISNEIKTQNWLIFFGSSNLYSLQKEFDKRKMTNIMVNSSLIHTKDLTKCSEFRVHKNHYNSMDSFNR